MRNAKLLVDHLSLFKIPGKSPFGIPSLLSDPKFPVRTKGQARRIHHAIRIVSPFVWSTANAKCIANLSVTTISMHLMSPAIAHPKISLRPNCQARDLEPLRPQKALLLVEAENTVIARHIDSVFSCHQMTGIGKLNGAQLLPRPGIKDENLLFVARPDKDFSIPHRQPAQIVAFQIRMFRARTHLHGIRHESPFSSRKLNDLPRLQIITSHGEIPRRPPRVARKINSLRATPTKAILRAVEILLIDRDDIVPDPVPLLMFVSLHELSIRIQRHQRPPTFGYRRRKEDVFSVTHRMMQQAVIRSPGPGIDRLAAAGKRGLKFRLHPGMRNAPPTIIPRSDQLASLIKPIPNHGVLPLPKGLPRDQIAHPLSRFIFDYDTRLPVDRLTELQTYLSPSFRDYFAIVFQIKRSPARRIIRERRMHWLVIQKT